MIRLFAIALLCVLPSFAVLAASPEETLDEFHRAAASADLDAYFGLMTEDVVFLGTDGTERWQGREFRDFVRPHFEAGRGWEYLPSNRHVLYSADGKTAWFDEALENAQLGHCRGSGVLVRAGSGWKVAQYNLSVPVPNELVLSVVEQIQEGEASPTAAASETDVETGDVQEPAAEKPVHCRKKRHKTNKPAGC